MKDQVQDALLIPVLLPTNNTFKSVSPVVLAAVLSTSQVLSIVMLKLLLQHLRTQRWMQLTMMLNMSSLYF